MLPLLQMSPHAVTPPQSNLDTLSTFPNNDAATFNDHHPRNVPAPYQQSFAIRTSRPHRHTIPYGSALYPPRQEHHLRRKTPNGTVDAGYDGSPSLFSHGPPPSKHLVLPRSATATAFPLTGPPIRQSHYNGGIDYRRPSSVGNTGLSDDLQARPGSSTWAYGSDTALHHGALPTNHYGLHQAEGQYIPQGQPEAPGVFPNLYQPIIRAHEYNVRAFCPPPIVMNESLPFGQPGMHTPWNYHGRPGLVSARHVQPQDLRSFQQHCGSDLARCSSFASGFDSETQHHPGFDSGMYTQSYLRPPHMSSQQGFREKVLLQAHRVYVDLLAYAQTIRKPQTSKGAAGHNTSPRLLVYPKPPKPSLRISEAALGQDTTLFKSSSENDSYQDFQSRGHVVPYFQGPYNSYSSTDQYQEALEWFSRITALDSSHVEAITNKAATLYCLGRQDEAEKHWIRAVEVQPSYLEAVEHLVGLLYKKRSKEAVEIIDHVQRALRVSPAQNQQAGPHDQLVKPPGFASSGYAIHGKENGRILALIHAKGTMLYSIKDVNRASEAFEEAVLISESPSTANNVGILLAGVQQIASNPPTPNVDVPAHSSIPGIVPGSGLALALAYYHYGLRLDPKHVHLHTNLGSLLKDIGQLDLAIQMYEQAVACDGTFDIALTNLANAVKDRGRINDAITYYKRAVSSNPEFAEAVCGLSTALNSVCDWRGRGGVILKAGKYDRWHVDDKGLLIDARSFGHDSGLVKRVVRIINRQLSDASHWGQGVLDEKKIASFARQIKDLGLVTSFDPEQALRGWSNKPWEGSRVILISQRNGIRISCSTLRLPWLPSTVYPPPPPPNPHLNIGYVSSDFNNHPLAHLMQSVFGFHNPSRARAICYAITASDRSVHRQQIEREAPVFRDVSSWPADKLVEQIIKDEIHILVNLNGYTRGARNEIFAARPAPVQMSFMGFAGTLGAEWCDYILADSTAIPPETLRPWRGNFKITDVFKDDTEGEEEDWMYSENIIYCRDTFFCCDHAQSCDASERSVTWEQERRRRWKMRKELFPALSDDTIIMGNFNQLYKIEPTTFRTWLRILAQVPKAVIWLLRFPELGEANLRRTAKAWAGEEVASRLIFTDVAPKSQHISRARVCDLFLDTPECNAHTTAADVLWSSTPLLTLPRYPYKMCSRMAASILKGALPKSNEGQEAAAELIAASEEEYEQRAVELATGLSYTMSADGYGQGDGRLADIRKLLWESKWHCGLFDTKRWVNDVETAYEQAWQRWVAGEGGDIYL
ncbi:Putative UDP-N-acetylglucosamine--peptide N-acetylglucosaminyltransferase SEC [Fusarium odoratissimum]|uniref:protein O-GlcNAc transferase n=1 Tax=Fusarium oxysporum f. sp. cubense (strain race 4) TaxID=2502994 RepID=N1RLJ5_FUSC4|nr:Putative UDP-N-acetylglucosamine--peptide N-acetylglucosaminyltransferase SEC [Fusarium odoratissimum]